jgi:signal transduction histidine kinase
VEHQLAETDRMVLSDLLLVARLDAGKLEVAEKPFELALVLAEEAERFGARAAAKGVELEIENSGELPARGDAKRTGQILAVLLDNAVRFAPEGGRIEVTGRLGKRWARASVMDTGPGIAPEHLPRLYEAEGAHPPRSRRGNGPWSRHRTRPRPRPGRRPRGREGGGLGGRVPPQPTAGVSEQFTRATGP